MGINEIGQYVDDNYGTVAPNRVVFNLNYEADRIAAKCYTAFSNDPKKIDEIQQAINNIERRERVDTQHKSDGV